MKLKIWAALLTIYLVWGSTYLAISFAVQSIPPFLMAGFRFLVAGGILFAVRLLLGDPLPRRIEWRGAAIVGLFLLLGGNGGVVWAEQRVASMIAALMIGATPFWIVLVDAVRPNGVHPNWRTIAGLVVGFIGIILLVSASASEESVEKIDLVGVIALLLASLSWAIGSVYGRTARLPVSPLMGTAMEMLAGGAGLLVLGTVVGEWGRLDLSSITSASWTALVYLILIGSLLGFAAYSWLIRVAPLSLVSTYAYVNPLVAIFLGSWIASEPVTLRIVVSAVIILSAVALINWARIKSPSGKQTGEQAAVATGE
jgi:drug/metabolite transporter (DMT)-like permease